MGDEVNLAIAANAHRSGGCEEEEREEGDDAPRPTEHISLISDGEGARFNHILRFAETTSAMVVCGGGRGLSAFAANPGRCRHRVLLRWNRHRHPDRLRHRRWIL